MKAKTLALTIMAALLGLAMNLHSQGVAPKSTVDRLRELKAKNEEIVEKQKAALLKLDEMDKQAEQLRFLSKRS